MRKNDILVLVLFLPLWADTFIHPKSHQDNQGLLERWTSQEEKKVAIILSLNVHWYMIIQSKLMLLFTVTKCSFKKIGGCVERNKKTTSILSFLKKGSKCPCNIYMRYSGLIKRFGINSHGHRLNVKIK